MSAKKVSGYVEPEQYSEDNAVENQEAPVQETPMPDTIGVSVKDALQLYELYKTIEAADAHFESCQSRSFRDFMQRTYKATNVEKAYATLKASLQALNAL